MPAIPDRSIAQSSRRSAWAALALLACLGPAAIAPASPLKFSFTPTGALAELESTDSTLYGKVLGGFATAGEFWSSRLQDDMTINVTIELPALPRGIVGYTEAPSLGVMYSDIRMALTMDRKSADDFTAVAALPSGDSLSFLTNNTTTGGLEVDDNGSANNLYLDVTRANLKALGFDAPGFLEPNDAVLDASISFSNAVAWDFDRSDGIGADTLDFVGVAIHEIGHTMGFLSGVATVDYFSAPFGLDPGRSLDDVAVFSVLDLFRHGARNGGGLDFATDGVDAENPYFSLDGGLTALATFSTGQFNGDGWQAHHWKDGLGIGIMEPVFAYGELKAATALDVRAFDAIGYDLVVPEIDPAGTGSVLALVAGALGLLERRRQRNGRPPSDTFTSSMRSRGG